MYDKGNTDISQATLQIRKNKIRKKTPKIYLVPVDF